MLTLGLKKAEKFVRDQQELGNDVRWENYTMIFFRPSPASMHKKEGAFRNEVWGFDNRVEVNDKGLWEIDQRNVKQRIRNTGSRR